MLNIKYNNLTKYAFILGLISFYDLNANSITNNTLVYFDQDTVNIEKCNSHQWCKIKNKDLYIKGFRIKQIDNKSLHKVISTGKTYTYVKTNNIDSYIENYLTIINDEQISLDAKLGYLRTTVISDYYSDIQKKEKERKYIKELYIKQQAQLKKERLKRAEEKRRNLMTKKKVVKKDKIIIKEPVFTTFEDKKVIKQQNIDKKSSMFQSMGILLEKYEVNRIDNTNINHPIDNYFGGFEYKIGLLNESYRYYLNLRATNGYEALVSTDYITNSKIFFGASIGYGRFEINDTSSSLSGALYGGQIGYMFNDKFEISYQMLKSNMNEKVSNVNYEINTFNYISLNYKF